MLNPTAGRNRPVNVVLPPFLLAFTRKLGWATRQEESSKRATECGAINPGSHGKPVGERIGDHSREVGIDLLWDSLLSKFDDGKSSAEKEVSCWDRFKQAEDLCKETNWKFKNRASWVDITNPLSLSSIIQSAAQKIAWLLGDYDESEHRTRCNFSSGASTRLPRKFGLPPFKYSGLPETTYDNATFAMSAILAGMDDPEKSLWFRANQGVVQLTEGNRVTSVPKNYKTNRAIAIEPCLNMYVQKGLGSMIRRRLKAVGVDLDDQTNNQRAAHKGSLDGSLATVDLSMASDTVSYELVKALLPWEWFAALVACRSHSGGSTSGAHYEYEKFSSMGNGATFELESLIFWAICSACAEAHGSDWRSVLVYGDDLILPTRSAQYTCDILQDCGFRVNTDKSHFSGDYRESCGKHYFQGADVTPFFVKSEDSTLVGLFKLHNQLYRWINRTSHTRESYERLMAVIKWLRAKAPGKWQKPRIPDGIGDGAFIGTFDECCPDAVRPALYGWEGFRVKVLQQVRVSPTREKSPRGIRGAYLVSTSLRLSYEGFLCSLLAPERPVSFLSHLAEPAPSWSGLSQVLRYEVKTCLVVHFP